MSDDDDNLIQFPTVRPAPVMTGEERMVRGKRRDHSAPYCPHDAVVVSMEVAEVDCGKCGAPLDPWTALRALAQESDRMAMWIAADKRERAVLRKEVEALKKERAKLRRGLPRDVTARVRLEAQLDRSGNDD